MMPDPAVPHKIRLERRTFGELLTNPSKESLEILKSLFSSTGPFARAAAKLGLVFESAMAPNYIHVLEGSIFVPVDHELIHLPKGLKKWKTLWNLQRHLREFPKTFYQQDAKNKNDIEERYATTALLTKLAIHRRDKGGINIDELWRLREAWCTRQGPNILLQDIDLQHPNEDKPRQVWSKPTTLADIYAILREDAKDDWRKTLPQIKAELPSSPLQEPPLEVVVVGESIQEEKDNAQKEIKGTPVSPGEAKGIAVLPTSPTDDIPANAIIIVRALTPAWDVMLNKRPLGVIAEFGGALSHGAIQCRERNIPAIFGVQQARELFIAGSHLHLNATKNTITALE